MDIDEPIFLQSVLSPAQTDSYDFVEAKETIGRRNWIYKFPHFGQNEPEMTITRL
jgi:hypothetical protein